MSQDILGFFYCSVCLIPSLALKPDFLFFYALKKKMLLCEVGSERVLQDLSSVAISSVNL